VIILCGVEARLCGSEEVGAGASTLNFVAFHFQVVSATRIAMTTSSMMCQGKHLAEEEIVASAIWKYSELLSLEPVKRRRKKTPSRPPHYYYCDFLCMVGPNDSS